MAFPQDAVTTLLVACHRRCCICHRFCGFKMETDHIVPKGEGGSDDIDNAIAVCFECHAEIHLYNPQHPRGRRYRPEELRAHRDQWLELCRTSAQFLASVPPTMGVGPIQALIDELEFNRTVSARHDVRELGAPMDVDQFDRAVGAGALSLMADGVKNSIFTAYVAIKRANTYVSAIANFPRSTDAGAQAVNNARDALRESIASIDTALAALRQDLAREA